MNSPTAFLGLSHLGIVSSICWSSKGIQVIALDPDQRLVGDLSRGQFPLYEPGLAELLDASRSNIRFSSDLSLLEDCPLIIVAADVPTSTDNTSDLNPIQQLIDQAVPHLGAGTTLVVLSQVPPGFTRQLGARIRSARPGLPFNLLYTVETLIFGDAVNRSLYPERFIVGLERSGLSLPPVYEEKLSRFNCPILPMTYESAELAKISINIYLIGSVTYANQLADVCERVGADWSEITQALRLDKRIGPAAYIKPSLGVAGGNLERDLATVRDLCRTNDVPADYLNALAHANEQRFQWVHRKLNDLVFQVTPHPNLAVWGLTYKKNTLSTKNSPAIRLISELNGKAAIKAWDPAVPELDCGGAVELAASRDDVLDQTDCLLVMADWDEFAEPDLDALRKRMRRPLIIDCTGLLQQKASELAGIQYVTMGRMT